MTDRSQAFKALGHPHRLALVRRLMDQAVACDAPEAPQCCDFGELADEIGVGKPTVSHHLTVLQQAGLIERIQKGRRVHCRINKDRLDDLRSFLTLDPQSALTDA